MAWSIFQQGGGQGAAVTWAEKLQQSLGIQPNPADTQFIYDWEVSEGGGGAYNPLNQGPVPGHPELTTTGSQYGGGAADFADWNAGLQGAVDYLNMPAYAGVLQGLQNQNYQASEQALFNSPWAASHYGYGSAWSTSAPPGATPINLTSATTPNSSGSAAPTGSSSPFSFWNLAGIPDPIDALERLGLILFGAALILVGIYMLAGKQTLQLSPVGRFMPEGRTGLRERREALADKGDIQK